MEQLTVVAWKWGSKYSPTYVDKLKNGIARHLKQPHRFFLISPDPNDPLLSPPGCLVRLKMFDPAWQRQYKIQGRLVCIDLDVVITGDLDPLFDRSESFVIVKGANTSNPCPFNGSLMMLRAGAHPEVWRDFNMADIHKIRFHEFPDDQGWIWHKLPRAAGWQVGEQSGVWAFRKRGWPADDHLPSGARLVCFPGRSDPDGAKWMPWIQKHWN